MGRNDNPWEQVAALAGIAALAGAGVGAGSALMFAERRAGAQDRELESLAQRVTMLARQSRVEGHERVRLQLSERDVLGVVGLGARASARAARDRPRPRSPRPPAG